LLPFIGAVFVLLLLLGYRVSIALLDTHEHIHNSLLPFSTFLHNFFFFKLLKKTRYIIQNGPAINLILYELGVSFTSKLYLQAIHGIFIYLLYLVVGQGMFFETALTKKNVLVCSEIMITKQAN
jgi:hypothetical protein